jgi:hypothetical protein
MKRLIACFILFYGSVSAAPIQCGLAPLPPLGCSRGDAVCDANGSCHWE